MMAQERYDINRSFEENKKEGPYGYDDIEDQNGKINEILGDYGIDKEFFGYRTRLPIGVAAGPLFNQRYMKAAALDGFNVLTWKTFRSEFRLAHRNDGNFFGHNIVFIDPQGQISTSTQKEKLVGTLQMPSRREDVSITNSFGMGSDAPDVWSKEIPVIDEWMKSRNKMTIASLVASPKSDWSVDDLAGDFADLAKIATQAGSRIIELNFSCPNVSCSGGSCNEGSIFKNSETSAIICRKVRESMGPSAKLLIKVGYMPKDGYRELIQAIGPYIDGLVAINTIPMEIVDENGKQALPGGMVSGVCGHAILDMAVEAVRSLIGLREELGLDLKIIGCGGVTNPEAAMRHIDAGADFVMVGTAALFNPLLPLQFAEYIRDNRISM